MRGGAAEGKESTIPQSTHSQSHCNVRRHCRHSIHESLLHVGYIAVYGSLYISREDEIEEDLKVTPGSRRLGSRTGVW